MNSVLPQQKTRCVAMALTTTCEYISTPSRWSKRSAPITMQIYWLAVPCSTIWQHIYPDKTGEQYHDFDATLAAEVLAEVDFPPEKIEAVLYAIAHHGSDAAYKAADEPVEVTLLRDADKLDVFGPIGVARIIMVRTLKGDTLEQIVDDFYIGGHLKRKWESITYDAARVIAKDDYVYSESFFAGLQRTLTNQHES
jgi:hypothetical protein